MASDCDAQSPFAHSAPSATLSNEKSTHKSDAISSKPKKRLPEANAYYLPSSPAQMFLYPPIEKQKEMGEEQQKSELDKENDGGSGDEEEQQKNERKVLRRIRLYRTLMWLQFSFTVFTCVFILIILILIAIILFLLSKTINRADHAIRENPVSQMYMKLKHAVDRIPGPGR